jgi:hypothetical protein
MGPFQFINSYVYIARRSVSATRILSAPTVYGPVPNSFVKLLLQPEYHIFMVAGTTRSVYEARSNHQPTKCSHEPEPSQKRLGRFDEAEGRRETLAGIKTIE